MTKDLDLADIQGNIIRAYGRFGYPKARYFLLNIRNGKAGRFFINALLPHVTSALRWKPVDDGVSGAGLNGYPGSELIDRPEVTLNIGFSYGGLEALELSTKTLKNMPSEFIDGMGKRYHILSDVDHSRPETWDRIWRENAGENAVHIWISMNALVDVNAAKKARVVMIGDLEARTKWLEDLVGQCTYKDDWGKIRPGVVLLEGHGENGEKFQDVSAIIKKIGKAEIITAEEHFGYRDGIGDPVFEGQFAEDVQSERVKGRGKIMPDGSWAPLATGEFLLGHPDESQELPPSSPPPEFVRNGTFMAYRKLKEHVTEFNEYIAKTAKSYAAVMDISEEDAGETIKAKMVGRWTDGTPLVKAATVAERKAFRANFERELKLAEAALEIEKKAKHDERIKALQKRIATIKQRETDFNYADDFGGIKCPYSAHLRRGNARDMHDPMLSFGPDADGNMPKDGNGSALNRRRRIMRRGLPWDDKKSGEKGIIFMAVCASLFRQFEFVQQQWMQYGLDFQAGNDTCPVIGIRDKEFRYKFTIPADPEGDKPPYICADIPQLVTTRGGEYFFIPGLNALKMIARGVIDPT